MKKFGKFMLGCLGLILETLISALFPIASALLLSYVSPQFAFTFIINLPLSLYLITLGCNLDCTDKFIEWTFGGDI